MPVYHFTLHAYRSWRPNHPKGYTRHESGYLPPDPKRAAEYDQRAEQPSVVFEAAHQEILVLGCIDLCLRRGWRLHGVGTDAKHFHYVISWRGYMDWRIVRQRSKNILSYLLGKHLEKPGQRWFVRDGSRKRVKNSKHLNYLLDVYLPDHRGLFWRDGNPYPEDRYGILRDNPRL